MGDMGSTDGHPDMQMYGSTAAPTAGQVMAAAQLVQATDASLKRYANVQCDPATWQDAYTAQMLHVWVVPYPGGVFSDDLSAAATNSAVQAVLGGHNS
jgi:hypothetical protein